MKERRFSLVDIAGIVNSPEYVSDKVPKTKTPLELSGVAVIETPPKTPATLPFGPILSLLMETNSGCCILLCTARANQWT
jgi:hypothetical protein